MGSWLSQNTTACACVLGSASTVISRTTRLRPEKSVTSVYICENVDGSWACDIRSAVSKRRLVDSEYAVGRRIRQRFETTSVTDGVPPDDPAISNVDGALVLCACDTHEEL